MKTLQFKRQVYHDSLRMVLEQRPLTDNLKFKGGDGPDWCRVSGHSGTTPKLSSIHNLIPMYFTGAK